MARKERKKEKKNGKTKFSFRHRVQKDIEVSILKFVMENDVMSETSILFGFKKKPYVYPALMLPHLCKREPFQFSCDSSFSRKVVRARGFLLSKKLVPSAGKKASRWLNRLLSSIKEEEDDDRFSQQKGEREEYEVVVESGRFLYKASKRVVDTTGEPKGTKWIFVLSTTRTLYVAQKIKGKFQHSSFLAGGATLSAGRLVVDDGILTSVWPHSGHYLPTEENFQAFMLFLTENNVDLTRVQKAPMDEEFGPLGIKTPRFRKSLSKTEDQNSSLQDENQAKPHISKLSEVAASKILLKRSHLLRSKIAKLRIPSMNELVEEEFQTPQPPPDNEPEEDEEEYDDYFLSDDGFETAEDSLLSEDDFMCPKLNLFELCEDHKNEEPISQATILQRIHSHRRTQSYQLGEQLQFRWTSGAGPRIGCVRDYPSRLQSQVLEQVQLSPRKKRLLPSSRLGRETIPSKSTFCPENSI